jgi:opacity protein-like surface antigen
MVNRYFGMEVGYHDLGTLVEQHDLATQTQTASVKTKLSEFVFIAAYPWLDRVSIYAKGGGYYARSTLTSDFLAPAQSKARQYTYGAGVSWDIFRHSGVRLEYQRYNNIGGAEVGFHTDVELASFGAYFKF